MTHRPTTVLIAEDDPVFRRVMGFSIARTGLTVESVGNGLAASPTILCTAKGLELDSRGLEERFKLVAVMHKPFSPRKLSDLILKHVGDGQLCPPPTLTFAINGTRMPQSDTIGNG